MDKDKFEIKHGYIRPVGFYKHENGGMTSYCYTIEYDINGREISRTEPIKLGTLSYSDGSDFTQDDYNYYRYGAKLPNILDKFINLLKGYL